VITWKGSATDDQTTDDDDVVVTIANEQPNRISLTPQNPKSWRQSSVIIL